MANPPFGSPAWRAKYAPGHKAAAAPASAPQPMAHQGGNPAFGSPAWDAKYNIKPIHAGQHITRKRKKHVKHKPPLGTGQRFAALQQDLAQKGVQDPAALAASIGRKKFGASKFAYLSNKGK